MKYILELEDEPNKEYFGEGNYYRCKQIPYWSISESMRNRLEPYDEADRKTESDSENPKNCKVKNYCDDCLYTDTCDSKAFFYACTSKATISKMEQVDKDINVRSKDEPQKDKWSHDCIGCANNNTCEFAFTDAVKICKYVKTEPQTCGNCYYYSDVGVKCCDLEHDPTTPTTEACEFYEPKDEPQTAEEWYTYQDEQEYNDRWQTERSSE